MSLIGVGPAGDEHVFVVGVATPTRLPTGAWACRTQTHDRAEARPVHGEDSLQALCAGLSLIRLRLEGFLESGGRLFRAGGGDEISRDDLATWFSRVGAGLSG